MSAIPLSNEDEHDKWYINIRAKSYHLTRVPIPRFGFCFRRGLVSWVTNVGAEGPIREYSSREMPSGFLILDKLCLFGCDGPVETLFSRDSALRMSAAEPFIVKYWSHQVLPEPCGLIFPTDPWGRISYRALSSNRVTSLIAPPIDRTSLIPSSLSRKLPACLLAPHLLPTLPSDLQSWTMFATSNI